MSTLSHRFSPEIDVPGQSLGDLRISQSVPPHPVHCHSVSELQSGRQARQRSPNTKWECTDIYLTNPTIGQVMTLLFAPQILFGERCFLFLQLFSSSLV